VVSDPLSLQFILNGSCFKRSPALTKLLGIIYGKRTVINLDGMSSTWTALSPLNTVPDDGHRRIRAGLNPGFTASAVRKFTPIFQRAAETV
jgi:cytochrome P450